MDDQQGRNALHQGAVPALVFEAGTEGGFLGFGGEKVSDAERRYMAQYRGDDELLESIVTVSVRDDEEIVVLARAASGACER